MSEIATKSKDTTDSAVAASLYAKHEKIYPREVHGLFATLRLTAVVVLLGGYYLMAWFNWDGRQILLFDLPERKFYIFFWTFWPQDFFYLAIIVIIAALMLFFFTAIAGRLWCGYACPQTVWTEMFMWVEYKIEGDRPKQMKLDKMPWNAYKIRIKSTKHLIWILFGLWTGFTFVGYFTPIRELWGSVLSFSTGPWETFWILFYGFATWGNAGFMREQVCMYMCPYARFQSAMFDKDTLVISYDVGRGEPRGSRKRSDDFKELGLGSCIDCSICVQVCPTGIDIRDGMQYQCIGCAACIDACDDVMDKMGYDKGLVRYTTDNILHGGKKHILRPRIFVYGGFLLVLSGLLLWSMINRVPLELDVIRDRNALYRETYDGMIENVYTLKLINMDQSGHDFDLTIDGVEGMSIILDREIVHVPGGEVVNLPVRLKADPYNLESRSVSVNFTLQAKDNEKLMVVEDARFLGPFKN
ncbi:MAG: cytochrome c oxidase accessory protein CcoG [Gammaproteobacteria bacterium]|nr:MAG: cytochrome c oxidase accessory protein CcoG [Gammaproteobacteria bacterium]